MKRHRILSVAAIPLLAFGCGGGGGNHAAPAGDGGSEPVGADGGPVTGDNVAALVVDSGPPGTLSADVPYVSVTICIPGTTTCQTIDHITVDTGSSGLRIISSVLTSDLALPQVASTASSSLVECFQFDDGFTWGSVRQADVELAGEVAQAIPVQLIGDPTFATVPEDCSSSGPSENTVADFGAKGILGINQIVADCGPYCATQSPVATGSYYSCTGGTCTAVAVPVANQVSNPVAFFEKDSNGVVMQFPMVPAQGAATVSGSLVFGIGTADNNGLGSASVLMVDGEGNFTTTFDGQTLPTSFIDSGSNTFAFDDAAIPLCTSDLSGGFFCPPSTLDLMAENEGLNGVTSTVSFSVANSDALFGNASYSVFDDLGAPGVDNTSFDWGFPFFLGRSVFVAIDGAKTPGGNGPYFAY
ncbi:MAG TPA: DUF3443 domain-containing protein [Polyangiaceae bacterium]|jgi:hypothetical protein